MVSQPLDPEVVEARRKVGEEWQRFKAALPALIADPSLRGRYVVFKDGAVVAAFDTLIRAYDDAVERFGEYGGMVITRVEEQRVHRLGGGFRLPRPGEQ